MQTRVTPLARGDLDRCSHLYVGVFNAPPWNDRWTLITARQRLLDLLDTPGFAGSVLLANDELVGFAMGYSEQWQNNRVFYLTEMCVKTASQRQGFGTRLLRSLEKRLTAEFGATSIYLMTMRGGPAERFYAANGYRINERMVMMSCRLE